MKYTKTITVSSLAFSLTKYFSIVLVKYKFLRSFSKRYIGLTIEVCIAGTTIRRYILMDIILNILKLKKRIIYSIKLIL